MRAITTEHINQRLIEIGKIDIQMVGPYVSAKHKSKFRCICGFEWLACTDKILRPLSRRGCPKCTDRGIRKRISPETIKARALERGITLVGGYVDAKTKALFECSIGHRWEAAPDNVLKKRNPTGCPICALNLDKAVISLEEAIDRLASKDILIVDEFKGWGKKTTLKCRNGHLWEAVPSFVKKGCPSCAEYGFNPERPAWEYGFIRGGYLKIGITNNLKQRLSTHRRYGEFDLVHVRHRQLGQHALDWERRIKNIHGGRFVTKEQCPDGYTETFPVHLLEEIKQ